MATIVEQETTHANMAELWDRLGRVPLERILLKPPPGTATEADLIEALDGDNKRLCELIDGVLVEKAMGAWESMLGAYIGFRIIGFIEKYHLGIVLGADGPIRIFPERVRMPDVCFISWERMPGEEFPEDSICACIPELAVEVVSKSNTKREIRNKIEDYFLAGVLLVWVVEPKMQIVDVYESPKKKVRFEKSASLDGGAILPGFTLSLTDLFDNVGRKRKRK